MRDTQTDKCFPNFAEASANGGNSDNSRDEECRLPALDPQPPSRDISQSGKAIRGKSARNRACYKRRKNAEKNMHIWLPLESARKLDAGCEWIAASREGTDTFSRGSLIAALIDELTEERLSKISRLRPGMDRGLVLASFMARALDRLISDESAKISVSDISASKDGEGLELGLVGEAATEASSISDTAAEAGALSVSMETKPADPSEGSQPAPAAIIDEFSSLFMDGACPQSESMLGGGAIRP